MMAGLVCAETGLRQPLAEGTRTGDAACDPGFPVEFPSPNRTPKAMRSAMTEYPMRRPA